MTEFDIALPSKPRVVKEDEFSGVFEIDGLHPGYGHTLGNSLRRIILSSLWGAAITSIKIDGAAHEFTTLDGVKEDVINIILNLKKVRVRMHSHEPQVITINVKGDRVVTAADIETPTQVDIITPNQKIATLTTKNASFRADITVEKGIGFVDKEELSQDKVDVGAIRVDALFSPIRRANYEVENMRVGDNTKFNRLRLFIETDGSMTPREALEKSIIIMINQLKAIVDFQEPEPEEEIKEIENNDDNNNDADDGDEKKVDVDFLKTRVESIGLSSRTLGALTEASIRTVGGLANKTEEELLGLPGLGKKGIDEIKKILSENNIKLA